MTIKRVFKWSTLLILVGLVVWRWCSRAAGAGGIYQYLDNQALADLIAGKLPVISHMPRQAERRGVHFRVRDETSHDRQATIDSLRNSRPAKAVEDILVEGASWRPVLDGSDIDGSPI